jgi:hypothetical protein
VCLCTPLSTRSGLVQHGEFPCRASWNLFILLGLLYWFTLLGIGLSDNTVIRIKVHHHFLRQGHVAPPRSITEARFRLNGFAASPAVSTGIMVWQILYPGCFVSLPHVIGVNTAKFLVLVDCCEQITAITVIKKMGLEIFAFLFL